MSTLLLTDRTSLPVKKPETLAIAPVSKGLGWKTVSYFTQILSATGTVKNLDTDVPIGDVLGGNHTELMSAVAVLLLENYPIGVLMDNRSCMQRYNA